jgi:hypothetical protein
MGNRNPTGLRDQSGNQYCGNCEQDVYTKTPFSFFGLGAFIGVAMLAGILLATAVTPGFGAGGIGWVVGLPAGIVIYIVYWYVVKQPVCPMCNAKNFRSVENQQQE